MSLLTPQKIPVTLYRSSDTGAPQLSKTTRSVGNIIKTCLVTGYGNKAGAGWTLKHEDLGTQTRVLGFNDGTPNSLFLRLQTEDANTMGVQLVNNVTDANVANVVIQCETRFKFFSSKLTGEWAIIANEKGFWFFAQISHTRGTPQETGVFLFAGVLAGMRSDAFVIKHTSGSFADTDPDRFGISNTSTDRGASALAGVKFEGMTTFSAIPQSMWKGYGNSTPDNISTPLFFTGAADIYKMPVYSPSRSDFLNFEMAGINTNMMNFCTSTIYPPENGRENAFIPIDYWEY